MAGNWVLTMKRRPLDKDEVNCRCRNANNCKQRNFGNGSKNSSYGLCLSGLSGSTASFYVYGYVRKCKSRK